MTLFHNQQTLKNMLTTIWFIQKLKQLLQIILINMANLSLGHLHPNLFYKSQNNFL